MRTEDEIKAKIKELEDEISEKEDETETTLEDEGVEEGTPEAERLTGENVQDNEIAEKQIKILRWALGEIE